MSEFTYNYNIWFVCLCVYEGIIRGLFQDQDAVLPVYKTSSQYKDRLYRYGDFYDIGKKVVTVLSLS